MTAPTPYLRLPGTSREALTFYGQVVDRHGVHWLIGFEEDQDA